MYIKTKKGNTGHVLADKNIPFDLYEALQEMIDLGYKKINEMKNTDKALWLVAEGEYVLLKVETQKGEWVTIIKERLNSPFSHIIEPLGIESVLLKKQKI